MQVAKLTENGQITIPEQIRKKIFLDFGTRSLSRVKKLR